MKIVFVGSRRGRKTTIPLIHHGLHVVSFYCEKNSNIGNLSVLFRFILYVLFFRPEKIITDSAMNIGLVAYIGSVISNAHLIYRMRGDVIAECRSRRKLFHLLFFKTLFLRRVNALWPVSSHLSSTVSMCRFNGSIQVIPTPVFSEPPQLANIDRLPMLLCVTSFDFFEKTQSFIDCLDMTDAALSFDDKFFCVVLGSGKYSELVREKISTLQNRRRFFYLGKTVNLVTFYGKAFCLVYASDFDAYPSVLVEARASSLPLVVKESHWVRDFIDNGIDGLLFRNADELLQSLKALSAPDYYARITSESRRRSLSDNSLDSVGQKMFESLTGLK
jgi:glycosyltransferase involved in cell wall biosynthesis